MRYTHRDSPPPRETSSNKAGPVCYWVVLYCAVLELYWSYTGAILELYRQHNGETRRLSVDKWSKVDTVGCTKYNEVYSPG
jgi:hypothetical protein